MLNIQRRIEKPWGYEIIWAQTDQYVGKIIFIKNGHRLSRQYHRVKEETILVKEGSLTLEIGAEEYKKSHFLKLGDNYHIRPNIIHRFCAERGDVTLLEVSTPHLDDVVRLEDDYKRGDTS